MPHLYYNSYYEVNFKVLSDNIKKIKEHIGETDIMPVLKANAYGMGTVEAAKFLVEKFDCPIIACAQAVEGIRIREAGVTSPEILVMGAVPVNILPYAVSTRLQTPVFTIDGAVALNDVAKQHGVIAKAQIKIETGMNRIGVKLGEPLAQLLEKLKILNNIEITGAYTHYVQADTTNDEFTLKQFEIYKKAIKQIEESGTVLTYNHCCNTCAAEWFTEAVDYSTHIRVGSLMVGYSDITDKENPINIKESLSWRASITSIKEIVSGESISYSQFFTATEPITVATVSVGFGDGLYNPLAKTQGPVLVNDTLTRFLDTCMDQCFVDVTGIDCKVGDEVTLFGYSENGVLLSPKLLSKHANQVDMAFTTARTARVGVTYIK